VAVPDSEAVAATAAAFRAFASREAAGRSPAYAALAAAVAADDLIMSFVADLPPGRRQPALLFAAARYLLGLPDAPPALAQLRGLAGEPGAGLAGVMLARRTQTNEPARCAVLLPALAQLPEPLAVIDVGASAGLTLLYDRYSYDYGGHRVTGLDPAAPILRCQPRGPVPLPPRVPAIAWRAGLDLSPLDVTSDDDARWLSCLVWPGEGDRAERLVAAIAAARRSPPVVHRGDLLTGLPALAGQAPADATLVICHTSVLFYVDPGRREQFAATVAGLGAAWLSSEAPGVVPGVVPGSPAPAGDDQLCVLARDGQALGYADSHGTWLRWLA
jgi:hypothetical protein